jgi:AcrR family transcriptional regulator
MVSGVTPGRAVPPKPARGPSVKRGEVTRQAVVERAAELASRIGLESLTIGRLAADLGLSKSGLFGHFQSKEALQVQVLEHAAARFVDAVIRPALAAPRGEPRVRALFEHWCVWPEKSGMEGGCFFVAAVAELDDQPGPPREVLVRHQQDWLDLIGNVFRTAVAERHFRATVDPEQLAVELYGIMLAYHFTARLLRDPKALDRARAAFESLVARSRA